MIESVAIRPAEPDDMSAIIDVQRRALAPLERQPFAADRWEGLLNDFPKYFTYVAEDESLFGYVTGGLPDEEYFRRRKCGELISLCLLPSHGSQGYGQKLLVHGMTVLKRRMYEKAIVWLQDDNEVGLHLTAQLGFEAVEASRTINENGSAIAETCFEKALTDFF